MPIYEYSCDSCHAQFEELVTAGQKPICPKCQSEHLTRRLSVISTPSSGSKVEGGVCDPLPGGG
ncbi:MAG: zinc ribbon domain-containing protein [Planctomycetaceae bacterium]|nr:zinc ribbon domain-containing protein [Planctomycetaceae bacterium]